MPNPRPDLTEFQEQTEAIHVLLSSPEVVKKLENKQILINPEALSPRDKRPIEFTNGHLQLECLRGRWLVQNWKDRETIQPSWIAPEDNLLSALIRPPCNGNKPTAPAIRSDRLDQPAKNEAGNRIEILQDIPQEQTLARLEWPHENTTTLSIGIC